MEIIKGKIYFHINKAITCKVICDCKEAEEVIIDVNDSDGIPHRTHYQYDSFRSFYTDDVDAQEFDYGY